MTLLTLILFTILSCTTSSSSSSTPIFREYIGAEWTGVKFTDVPINPKLEFHFIISFAADYTTNPKNPTPTNGQYNIFWDTNTLTPQAVADIKKKNKNVKVALSLGGDSIGNKFVNFAPTSVDSWVKNAVSSLSKIIKEYSLDGLDIDYEHYKTSAAIFAECMGELIATLKKNRVISFASIAPYDDRVVQEHYLALWGRYRNVIDYVNFQFFAYNPKTSVAQFIGYFEEQKRKYKNAKLLVSFTTDVVNGGLTPQHGFFDACSKLKEEGKLEGIFVWAADNSLKNKFVYEKKAQLLLVS